MSDTLRDPSHDTFQQTAPDVFRVRFETTAGVIVFEIKRELAPRGVDRFHALVSNGFYDGVRFFRVIRGFMAQFGIHADPEVSRVWREARFDDDPVKGSNQPGTLSFATAGPNTRTTQLFINFVNNSRLDDMGFAPIGEVVEGMDVVTSLYADYGEGAPQGMGPEQGRLQQQGEAYLADEFPELDTIQRATVDS